MEQRDASYDPSEKAQLKRIFTLEKNLEQLNYMQQDLAAKKMKLKATNSSLEKMLRSRNETIMKLEEENEQMKQSVGK